VVLAERHVDAGEAGCGMTFVRNGAVFCLVLYLVITAVMYFMQRRLQYHPENKGLTPEAMGLQGVTVNRLKTPDGESLVSWYVAAKPGHATILYFQGNGGEIGDRPKRFAFLADKGFGVLYLSYRGYGGSTGEISEQGFITDALTAYDWLLGQGVAPGKIALIGESLGSGVAVQLAAQREVGAVALEAPYTSTADIAASLYWWLPVRLLMKDQFRSVDYIGKVKVPLLVTHGDADTVIPLRYGKALFAAANEPKELVVVPGFGHDLLFEPSTWAREADFFERVIGRE
jgi:fermentation-respiration switch protein FrsA (DUF1100 family)